MLERSCGALVGAILLVAVVATGCGGSGHPSGGGGSTPDTTPPSAPTGLTASVAGGVIDLSWTASTDNVGVVGYDVFRDGTYLTSVDGTSTTDASASRAIEHCYEVSARDFAGNVSARSTPACATIPDLPPTAALLAPDSALTGTEVTFDASASSDPDGTIVLYAFDFGDGEPVVTGTAPSTTHAFAMAGTYNASVTVTDNVGGTASATRTITIGLVLSMPVDISNTPTISQTPSMSRDLAGNLAVVWEEYGDNIMFSGSSDGGLTFSVPTYVVDPNGPLGIANMYSSGQMHVVAATGAIHIAWTIFDTYYGGAEIFYVRSTDGGATFGTPTMVSTADAVNSYGSSIAADDTGTVAIVWVDSDLNTGAEAIMYSALVGTTFSKPLVFSSPGLCPVVALFSSNQYVAWSAGASLQEQIFFSRSTDGGRTFSAPIALNQVAEKSWCPVIAVDAAGAIYVAWEEGTAYVDRKIMLATSMDAGKTFGVPAILSDPAVDSGCPSLVTSGTGRVVLTWTSGESFLVLSSDGGATFTAPLRIPPPDVGGRCYGLVSRAGNEVGLVWNADPLGGSWSDIYHRIATLSFQ